MPDSFSVDFSELGKLAADLGGVPDKAGSFINSAVQATSMRVKKAAAKSAGSGDPMWRALPSAIDYEITTDHGVGGSSLTSEIGYNRDKDPGKLGNVREYGTPKVGPHNDLGNALKANEADFERGLSEALKDAERAAGL